MSTTPDLPDLPEPQLAGDDEAAFDELARRAGAALRRPAPEDGAQVIVDRQRNRRTRRVVAVGGAAVLASMLVVLVVVSQREEPDRLSVSAAVPSLWVDLEPGATAPLPPAPIPAAAGSALVWTGTELIVWGGTVDETPCCEESQEGAAFDPATGTWRRIAEPPGEVRPRAVVWTGNEMAVWSDAAPDTVSAAYDPVTDTWRLIADPPAAGSSMAFWIGDEAVLLGDPDVGSPNFAYDPVTDDWRRLADGPWGLPAVWTGTTLITQTDPSSVTGSALSVYDPATDTWRVLEGLDAGGQPVVIPGRGGAAATVAFLPGEPGIPVELVDDRGHAIGELAGRPPDLEAECSRPPDNESCLLVSFHAVAVGGEVLFWYSGTGWALDPETQTWRSFPLDGRQPNWDGTEVVTAGDLLFAWGAGRDGLVYRAVTPG